MCTVEENIEPEEDMVHFSILIYFLIETTIILIFFFKYLILAIRCLRQLLARPTGGSLASLGNIPPRRSLRSPNPVYMTVEDP